jgi:hypothetical protein
MLALAAPLAAADSAASRESLPGASSMHQFGLLKTQSSTVMTIYTNKERDYGFAEYDLGVYAVAGDQPFEVRAVRRSYAKPIEATRVLKSGNKVLPSGLVSDFNGLSGFATIKFLDARGRAALSQTVDFCPNGDAQRINKDAPIDPYYPQECSGNPYSLGAVWGIQRGYAVPLQGDSYLDDFDGPLPKAGRYRAEVQVSPAYAKALGIPAKSAKITVSVRVKVIVEDDEEEEEFRKASSARAAEAEHASSSSSRILASPARSRKPTGTGSIPSGAPKPDLRALPAWSIAADGDYVVFAATVWNAGKSPLLVDGFRQAGKDVMDAYQYSVDAKGKQLGYQNVGTMKWDPREEHHHWHFKDFARYSLVDKNKKQLFVSKKEAFCLANTDAVDYTVKGADWHPYNTELETACGEHSSLAVREVLSSGSGDTYEQFRPGQSLSLKGRPNGTYYVKVEANPERRLAESDLSNNVSYRKITVGGKPRHRTVKAEKVGIINEPVFDDEFLEEFRH